MKQPYLKPSKVEHRWSGLEAEAAPQLREPFFLYRVGDADLLLLVQWALKPFSGCSNYCRPLRASGLVVFWAHSTPKPISLEQKLNA